MDSITLRLSEDMIEALDNEAGDHGVSRSEHIRTILETRGEHDRLRAENERLRRQLAATNARQDDVSELANYVERERAIQERREERREAPAWTRAKWWLLGKPAG